MLEPWETGHAPLDIAAVFAPLKCQFFLLNGGGGGIFKCTLK